MLEPIKTFSVKLKSFKYLAYLIFIFSIVYIINIVRLGTQEAISDAISLGIIAVIFGGFFWYFGNKTRKFVFYEDRLEYHTSKKQFESSWENVNFVKTYREESKNSDNLVITTVNEEILTVSQAHFQADVLIRVLEEIVVFKDKYNPEIVIDDDRNWLSS